LPNGVFTQYQYNAMNRLTEEVNFQTQPTVNNPNPTQLSRFGYTHYADGQRATAGEKQKKTTSADYVDNSLAFRYDGLNRLTQEDAVNPASKSEENPSGYGYTADYTYDLVGNRTLRHVEVTRDSNGYPVTDHLWTQYEYEPGTDRLSRETHTSKEPTGMLPWGQDRIYAYAGPDGSLWYGLPGSGKRIGSLGAFVAGLPSVWNRYAMILLAALLPLAGFGPMLAQVWRRIRGTATDGPRPTLGLYHRCLCVLFAYIFLVGPENFQSLASAEIQYSALSTATWGQSGRTIEYGYDANGAQIRKTAKNTSNQQILEEAIYEYDLRGQLKQVTTTPYPGTPVVTQYKYNPQGIRTEKTESGITTQYLIDPYNPTGYAQVLEERTVASSAPTTQNRVHYTLGDDVISQAKSVWTLNGSEWVLQTAYDTEYLLYDGHGSTRQLSNPSAGLIDNYSYDAYGNMLGSSSVPNPAPTAATQYLYTGEQYDKSLSQYYLRARYYNPSNGRFNQTDPFAGNPSDPQSLHKYLYAHCNPVNMNDPSGLSDVFSIGGLLTNISIRVMLIGMEYGPRVVAGLWAITEVTVAMWLASLTQMVLQKIGVLPPCEYVTELASILGVVLVAELFVLSMLPPEWSYSPTVKSIQQSGLRGVNNPRVKRAVDIGNYVHYDRTTDPMKYSHDGGPTQLKQKFPNTDFYFSKRGQQGVDVKYVGGQHPSSYPNSKWPSGINQADFKPDTLTGNAFKLPPSTLRISYDPQTCQIKL
jgi:RHS repeat-associated protein